MKVSLIIPTYNKLPRLKLVMASILNQIYRREDYEVIIIDDGSDDGTKDFIENNSYSFDLKYRKIKNSGRSIARNTGINMANNELLIFVDDDTVLSPDFIQKHVENQLKDLKVSHGKIVNLTYLKFFKDPSEGIFYPDLKDKFSKTGEYLVKKCISSTDIIEDFSSVVSNNNKQIPFEYVVKEVLTNGGQDYSWIGFTGGNVSVPREWIEKAGLFDENFSLNWGCEDLELGYRLKKLNYKFDYNESAVNYHIDHYRSTFVREHFENTQYFYNKHKDESIFLLQKFVEGELKKDQLIEKLKRG